MVDRKSLVTLILLALAVLGIGASVVVQVLSWQDANAQAAELRTVMLEARYEYKVVAVASNASGRTGEDAMKAAMVTIDEKELTRLGNQGWEIVTSFIEVETAYPNFGDAKYVTGLQTNVRPQRLILILRHRIG